MSHFTVLVIGENPEDQLQPFHEYECTGTKDEYVVFVEAEESYEELVKEYRDLKNDEKTDYNTPEDYIKDYHGYEKKDGKWGRYTNPNAKWDWYLLGGRWRGYFKLKEGKEGKEGEEGIVGQPGLGADEIKPGYVDAAILEDIDFEAMREEEYQRALAEYEKIERECGGQIPKLEMTWDEARKKYENIEEAREAYHAQESVKIFCNISNYGWGMTLEDYQIPKEEYAQNARKAAIATFAVVKDSKWYERGEMGWWGVVTNEKDRDTWLDQFNRLIDDLPPDTLLSIYDCHI